MLYCVLYENKLYCHAIPFVGVALVVCEEARDIMIALTLYGKVAAARFDIDFYNGTNTIIVMTRLLGQYAVYKIASLMDTVLT